MARKEKVTKVIDGDTFETSSRKNPVRLANVDAPQRGEPGAALGEVTSQIPSQIEMYEALLKEAYADGVVSNDERRLLDQLQNKLMLDPELVNRLERKSREKYGKVSFDELVNGIDDQYQLGDWEALLNLYDAAPPNLQRRLRKKRGQLLAGPAPYVKVKEARASVKDKGIEISEEERSIYESPVLVKETKKVRKTSSSRKELMSDTRRYYIYKTLAFIFGFILGSTPAFLVGYPAIIGGLLLGGFFASKVHNC